MFYQSIKIKYNQLIIYILIVAMSLSLKYGECMDNNHEEKMNDEFINLLDIDNNIKVRLMMATEFNFLGRPAIGYYAKDKVLVTKKTAMLLKTINQEVSKDGYALLIYDAYRPQMAVEDFAAWGNDESDIKMKEYFYPSLSKKEIYQAGYIAKKSTHSRGSTVDLTLIEKGREPLDIPIQQKRTLLSGKIIPFNDDNSLDMGSSVDLFDEVSHTASTDISEYARKNRDYLQNVMTKYGFINLYKEWWHFTLKDETFPDTYFNFPIK